MKKNRNPTDHEIADSIREHAQKVSTMQKTRSGRLVMGCFSTNSEWDRRFQEHPAILQRLNKTLKS